MRYRRNGNLKVKNLREIGDVIVSRGKELEGDC